MANINPSITPGAYPSDRTVGWSFGPEVQAVAYTVNGLPPVLSEYIAYDQLDPPNPFIAVTQDGRGNVLYDGGFPKLYGGQNATAHGATTFAELTPAMKYFHNALNWCANPEAIAQYGKRVLVLGDANEGENYNIIGTGGSNFRSTVEAICRVAGYTPTYLTRSHWGSQINCTLSELTQYACVFFFSTYSPDVDCITDNAVQDILTYRSLGGGLIFITDHGLVINSIENAWPVAGGSFFRTANKIIRNLGAWFSGDYNRTPVNVGFIRRTYGDHPLYANISDDESIYAGGSESRVFVQEYPLLNPSTVPDMDVTAGTTNIQFLLRLNDGRVETYRFIYNVAGGGSMLEFRDTDDTPVTEVDIGWDNSVTLKLEVTETGLGTVLGSIYRNTQRIGEFRYDQTLGSQDIWYAGSSAPVQVDDGDVIRAVIEQPFTYEQTVSIYRHQVKVEAARGGAALTGKLQAMLPQVKPQNTVYGAIEAINKVQTLPYGDQHALNVQNLRLYMYNRFALPVVNAYAFHNPTELNTFIATYSPPTLKQIFNNWDRTLGDSYFPKGVGATGDAAAWYWDEAMQMAVQPNNTTYLTAFISDEAPLDYDLAVTLTSTGSDDDYNTVTLAHYRDTTTGLNHTLDVVVCPSANNNPAVVLKNFYVQRDFNRPAARTRLIVQNDFNNISGTWSGKSYRVWVKRRGDQFTIHGSGWSTLTKKAASQMSFNLNDHPDLAIFKGGKSYGFGSLSQPNSSFKDVSYYGGFIRNIILDIAGNRIYRWVNTQWLPVSDISLHQIFGAPREIKSIEGNRSYRLNIDGTITIL